MNIRTLVVYWLPPIAWAAFIGVATFMPADDLPSTTIPMADKAAHFALFAILALLLFRAINHQRIWTIKAAAIIAFVLTVLYAAADEWFQGHVESRTPEFADWVADTIGAAMVFVRAKWQRLNHYGSESNGKISSNDLLTMFQDE